MVERHHKPNPLASTPTFAPQAAVDISDSRVAAKLPTGESVEVLLYGATVTSWKNAAGAEKLWLSDAAKLDGSKPVRGGIPIVFPVFGSAPDHEATNKLPSHGFARASKWDFLGSSGEGDSAAAVKLDFGLSEASLDEKTRAAWPYKCSLLYSVTLERTGLRTTLVVNNTDTKSYEVQALFHSYFRVNDISKVSITGLEGAEFLDKVNGPAVKTQEAAITFSGETDSVYKPTEQKPVIINESGEADLTITRDGLEDVVVWNPWTEKSAGMGDFEPKTGWQQMVCVEAGSVRSWQKLEAGDSWTGSQYVSLE